MHFVISKHEEIFFFRCNTSAFLKSLIHDRSKYNTLPGN